MKRVALELKEGGPRGCASHSTNADFHSGGSSEIRRPGAIHPTPHDEPAGLSMKPSHSTAHLVPWFSPSGISKVEGRFQRRIVSQTDSVAVHA